MKSQLKRLPQRGTWEIDVVGVPDDLPIAEVDLEGILVIVQRPDGSARAMAPVEVGQDITDTIVRAAVEPHEPHEPSRPRTIHCRKALAPRVQTIARKMGAALKFVDELPLIDAAVEVLLRSIGPVEALVPAEPERWTPWLRELVDLAPWEMLPDGLTFLLGGGPDEPVDAGGVAVLIGLLGEQRGINWFASADDHERFFELAERGGDPLDEVRVSCVHLDPVGEVPPPLVEAAREVGLVHGGLLASHFTMADGAIRAMDEGEEAACLAALVAVVTAVRQHGVGALLELPTSTSVPTPEGSRTVVTVPPPPQEPDEPYLVDNAHQIISLIAEGDAGRQPTLVIKMAAADARRVADHLEGIDAIALEPSAPERIDVVGWAGPIEMGAIVGIPDDPALFASWTAERRGLLMISAGGAKRAGARPEDVVAVLPVQLLEAEGPGMDSFWRSADAIAKVRAGSGKERDPAEVFLDFARPLFVDQLPVEEARMALDLAALVWTLAAVEDHGGPSSLADAIRGHLPDDAEGREFVQMLRARKRGRFADDARAIGVRRVQQRGGRLTVKVDVAPVREIDAHQLGLVDR